jgi:hypothetical protein
MTHGTTDHRTGDSVVARQMARGAADDGTLHTTCGLRTIWQQSQTNEESEYSRDSFQGQFSMADRSGLPVRYRAPPVAGRGAHEGLRRLG